MRLTGIATTMRRAGVMTAVMCGAVLAPSMLHAQDWAKAALAKSPRHGEYVTIKEPGGRALQAFVVYPEIKDKAPVVVLIHEIFGESDWFKLMADDLAAAGYIVIAPDLLSGYGPAMTTPPAAPAAPANAPMDHMHMDAPSGGAAMMPMNPGGTAAFPDQNAVVKAVTSLPDAQVMGDLDAAEDYGKSLPSANGKLYIAGFCWGGGKSFLYATHRKDLSAAFVFYGPPPPVDLMKNITAPVYGFYAENDARITATIPKTQEEMTAAGKKYDPKTYAGAGHGFMRAGEAPDASAANSAARAEGFRRLVDLLGGMH